MSKYLKYFKAEFEKYAQDELGAPPARPSRGGQPRPSHRGGVTGVPSRPGHAPTATESGANPAIDIKNMQQAMQQFASAVTKYSFKKPTVAHGKPTVDDSKKPFNDFITEQYMMDSPIKGQEFSADPTRQKMHEKQPTDLIEMNNVIDSLKRIGTSANELKADNTWDFRTNNALKNIYSFAYALVNLSKDFGRTNVNSFNDEDLSKMAELIPKEENPSEISVEDKIAKSKALVPVIKKLTNFYNYYVDAIANHPGYVRYIIGEEPLMTIKPGDGDPLALTAEEQKMMPNLDQLSVDFGKGPLPLSAFKNINYFRQFLTEQMNYQPNQTNNPKVLQAFLSSFVNMADQYIQKAQPKQQTAVPAKQEQIDAGTPSGTGGIRQV
jgi:hypothetical protein